MNAKSPFPAPLPYRVSFIPVLLFTAFGIAQGAAGQLRPNPAQQAPVARDARVVSLKPGSSIQRKLSAGAAHTYRVAMQKGQCLRVTLNQRGTGIYLDVSVPTGNQTATIKGPNETRGSEQFRIIAKGAGEYVLAVKAPQGRGRSGAYEIKTAELRESTPRELQQFAVESAFLEAAQLFKKGDADSLKAALAKYEEVRLMTREIGEREKEAQALVGLGNTYRLMAQTDKEIQAYVDSSIIFGELGYRPREASGMNSVGVVYLSQGDNQKALEWFERALARCPAADSLAGIIHTNIGQTYDELGNKQQAIDHFEQALKVFKETAHWDNASGTLNNLGRLYNSVGDTSGALRYYQRCIRIARKQNDQRGEAIVLNNMGNSYLRLGENQRALEYYNQALQLRRVVGDAPGRAITLSSLGNVYIALDENQKALDYLNEALPLMKQFSNSKGEAITLLRIGMANTSMGKADEAAGHYHRSLQLSREIGDRATESATLYALARLNRKQGNLDKALENIETALPIIESLRRTMLSPEMRATYFAAADDYYDSYVDLLMQLDSLKPDRGFERKALDASERRRARSLIEMLAEAKIDIRHGVDPALLERERSLKQTIDARTERYINLQPRKRGQQGSALKQEIEELLEELRNSQARIRSGSPHYAALMMPSPFTLDEIQREILDDDTLLLEYWLGEEHSFLWAVTRGSVMAFRLPKKAEIERAARRIGESLTALGQSRGGRAGTDRESSRPKAGRAYQEAASELSRMILSPVAAQLGNKRLLVVADGPLSYVPFAALPDSEAQTTHSGEASPLILRHEIVIMPSASTLGVLRRELSGRATAPKSVAVFADPVFEANDDRYRRIRGRRASAGLRESDRIPHAGRPAIGRSADDMSLTRRGSFPRLLFSRREAEAICSLSPPPITMKALDFDSNKKAVLDRQLKDYRLIHFATHSLLNSEHPELSGIVMSLVNRRGKPQDGFVRLLDIYHLELNADLVVLSGCKTALGKNIRAEGLVGLTRGFMYAGAARVLASLWNVDDEGTTELMTRFYRAMLVDGQGPAAALRTAQLGMLKQERWRSPYYWAGFVLQGEWR